MNLLNRKLIRAHFHVGVHLGAKVLTSLDILKDDVELSMTEFGVYARFKKSGEEYLIPFANCHSAKLEPEANTGKGSK